MSSQAFENAADDFQDLHKAIENLIQNKLPRAQGESRKQLVTDINRRLDAAKMTINDMQKEVDRAPNNLRPKLNPKLRAYQSDLNTLKRLLDSECSREQLMGGRSGQPDIAQDNRTKILRNTAAVDRSSAAIMRTEGLAAETEDIGNEITVELGQQREQLYRTRGMLDETDSALDKSRKHILNMARRAMTNKVLLIVIIIVELGILGLCLYWKFR